MDVGIYAAASYFPQATRTPDELLHKHFGQSIHPSTTRLAKLYGIKHRHIAPPDTLPSDLAIPAARQALEQSPGDIDAVLFAGMKRDRIEPATASTIAEAIGSEAAITIDMSDACHGFGSAMMSAHGLLATGKAKRVLIATGELGSLHEIGAIAALRHTAGPYLQQEYEENIASATLGDGGSAIIMGPAEKAPIRIGNYMPLSKNAAQDVCRIGEYNAPIKVDQPLLTSVVKELIWPAFQEFTDQSCTSGKTYYIVHQVSGRVLRQMVGLTGASFSQFVDTVSEYGNIVSATFAAQLAILLPKLRAGDTIQVCLTGSGVSASFWTLPVQFSMGTEEKKNGSNNRDFSTHTSNSSLEKIAASRKAPLATS